jgi:LDH2 family malate/lactate/ureidoglycolate dehydrogenase
MAGVHSWNTQPGRDADTWHSFIVVNPAFFGGGDAFRARIDAMIDGLKACPPCEGATEVLYPGELEWRREAAARRDGFMLPEASEKELACAAAMV